MESVQPLFSVITPVYNVCEYLLTAVQSVVEQPGPKDWECLLIDDGSTDGSAAFCDALAGMLPGVKAIHQPNQGVSAARNTGLRAARGRWVLFLDGDDCLAPDLLPQLRQTIESRPECDWLAGRFLIRGADGTLCEHTGLQRQTGVLPADAGVVPRLQALYAAGHWSVWKFCIRHDLLENSGAQFWPQVRWGEEFGFDLQLMTGCGELCLLDIIFLHYREGRPGSLLNNEKGLADHFLSLQATWQHLEEMAKSKRISRQDLPALRDMVADMFWPQARTAAVRDAAVRRACLPGLRALGPLYPYGTEVRTRSSWRLFELLLRALGPRPALWLASRQR